VADPLHCCGPLVVVMGVSGSGKTTVGAALARRLRLDYADADAFHDKGGYPFHCPWGATPLLLVVNGRRRHNGWGSGTASWCLGAVKWIPPLIRILGSVADDGDTCCKI